METAVKLEMQCCADDEMEMREVRLSKATPVNCPRQLM
jgi:hypothetical protein